ncbi:39S ribosomal protein L52, mitochondrial isoform A [Alligator mississippiensis]|uniref:Large ribosomal subunit protein mL52 n=1 Tax=Alligator mississippiensis TaxID=8496 RepID=A0A151MYT1_ALLMI|nr:39S ribosomal protein L52, mitochondrial isoform A [Alligator mississippiensis]
MAPPGLLRLGAPLAAATRQGLAPSSAGYGPLRDLPDWSFADGRPAPPWKGQLRRQQENEDFARRVVTLSAELSQAKQRWEKQQEEAAQEQKRLQLQRWLQPKGGTLRGGGNKVP